MAGEEGEVCAICLDSPSKGAVTLACRHTYHAACLLSAFAEETPGQWKCPCCRTPVVSARKRAVKGEKSTRRAPSRSPGADAGGAGEDEAALLMLPPGRHFYAPEESRWATMQAFLAAAACALADDAAPTAPGAAPPAARHASPCHGARCGNLQGLSELSKGAGARVMAAAERWAPPTAASVSAFLGHSQLQRLLDPSLPHPTWRAARYAFALFLSIIAAGLALAALRLIMDGAGAAVCAAADAVGVLAGVSPFDGAVCVPMTTDGWILPLGFAAVGLYIAVQGAWASGASLRRVALRWDHCAAPALAVWFGACLGYTAFVYGARVLLTVLVSLAGPLPRAACFPTLDDPC